MAILDWRRTEWGYESAGYRVVAGGDDGAGPWRLEPNGPSARWQNPADFQVTLHSSIEDATAWAEQNENEVVRRMVASGHFLIAGISLALFVFSSQFIGSLPGLALVAGAFYLTLRSAGNGLGVVLREAWGWTRPRSKPTILERLVGAAARLVRSRQLAAGQPAANAGVRELAPDPLRRIR